MVVRLISQLAHVEIISPRPEATGAFLHDLMGLESSGQSGQSSYYRGWGEFFHHSVQVTEGKQPAVAHTGWRTEGPAELEEAVARLECAGAGIGWQDAVTGHGPAYRFRAPGGQVHEVFWECERYRAPAALLSNSPNRPQRYITRGVGARRLDHATFNTDDPMRDARWYEDTLGFRFMEFAKLDGTDLTVTAFVSSTPMSHDLGLIRDAVDRTGQLSGVPGRTNHVAFWVDSCQDVLRAADLYRDAGLAVEYGPGRHGVGENLFLYVREPGGMRIELFSGGYMLYAPDLFPMEWKVSDGSLNYWNPAQPVPDGYLFDAFPPVESEMPGGQPQGVAYRV